MSSTSTRRGPRPTGSSYFLAPEAISSTSIEDASFRGETLGLPSPDDEDWPGSSDEPWYEQPDHLPWTAPETGVVYQTATVAE